MGRLVDENDVYSVLTEYYHHNTATQHMVLADALSTVKTAEAIPVEWIGDYLAWLKGIGAFALPDANAIKSMLKKWEMEQGHSDCGPDYCNI